MNAMHDYRASTDEIANHFNIARSTVYRPIAYLTSKMMRSQDREPLLGSHE